MNSVRVILFLGACLISDVCSGGGWGQSDENVPHISFRRTPIQYYWPTHPRTTTRPSPPPFPLVQPTNGSSSTGSAGSGDLFPKMRALVDLVRVTLKEMWELAKEERADIGSAIAEVLEGEVKHAVQLWSDWMKRRKRVRREVVGSGGEVVYNQIGQVLVDSNEKIGEEKGGLSSETQEKIDQVHMTGVCSCEADICKDSCALKKKVKGATRQG